MKRTDMTWKPQNDWFHESNVQRRIKNGPARRWGTPIAEANAIIKNQGPDLLFQDGSRRLRIEVKGFPSRKYVSGKRMGKTKKAIPSTQAPHRFGEALTGLIKAKSKDPKLSIALDYRLSNLTPDYGKKFNGLRRELVSHATLLRKKEKSVRQSSPDSKFKGISHPQILYNFDGRFVSRIE
jgi:hypothetical protein